MSREINQIVLEQIKKRLPLVKSEHIYFFDDDVNKRKGVGIGDFPMPMVIGINYKLNEKEQIVTVLHEIIESVPRRIRHGKRDERKIDAIAYKIYRNNKEIRNYISKEIEGSNKKVLESVEEMKFWIGETIKISKKIKCT